MTVGTILRLAVMATLPWSRRAVPIRDDSVSPSTAVTVLSSLWRERYSQRHRTGPLAGCAHPIVSARFSGCGRSITLIVTVNLLVLYVGISTTFGIRRDRAGGKHPLAGLPLRMRRRAARQAPRKPPHSSPI